MPILPLDHPEPSFATLGVMLYPATDESDPPKAQAYVAQVLARAFSRFREAGGNSTARCSRAYFDGCRRTFERSARTLVGRRQQVSCSRRYLRCSTPIPGSPPGKMQSRFVDSTTKSSKVAGRDGIWRGIVSANLEPNPRTPKQRGIRSRIQPVPERHKIVL